jgi:phenylalanyl-tRNA synthetase beta chain
MGADVPDKQIESSLSALGFSPVRVDQNRGAEGSLLAAWECTQPSWRAEVEREIDLIEEVARIYGLDKFPPRLPAARQGAARLPHYEAEARLRERLIGLGYQEILTIPHVAEDRDALFRPPDVQPARLANPLSEEANVLKSTGIATMTSALEWNLNRGQRNVRLFEIGHRYSLRDTESVETPILTIGATGQAREKGLYDTPRDYSFADLKGDIDALGALANSFTWNEGDPAWLHPARRGHVLLKNETLGEAGELTRRVADQLKLRQSIFLAELELQPLYAAIREAKESRKYEPIPRFPAVERDFSLLLADGTHFADVVAAIRSLTISEIASIDAVDLYRGKNVPAGQCSLLVRVTFQSRETTLTEAQLTDFSTRIIAALEKLLSAHLRAN